MTLMSSDLQSDSDLDSIRNSCDVLFGIVQIFLPEEIEPGIMKQLKV